MAGESAMCPIIFLTMQLTPIDKSLHQKMSSVKQTLHLQYVSKVHKWHGNNALKSSVPLPVLHLKKEI